MSETLEIGDEIIDQRNGLRAVVVGFDEENVDMVDTIYINGPNCDWQEYSGFNMKERYRKVFK